MFSEIHLNFPCLLMSVFQEANTFQRRIQDFLDEAPTREEEVKAYLWGKIFVENCMTMKEIGPGARP